MIPCLLMGLLILPLAHSGAYYKDLKDMCVKVEGILKIQENMKEIHTGTIMLQLWDSGLRVKSDNF